MMLLIAALTTTLAAAQTPAEPNDIFEQSRALRRQFMLQKASPVAVKTPLEEETSLAQLIEQVLSLTTPAMQDPNALLKASESAADPNVAAAADTPTAPKNNLGSVAAPDRAVQTGTADQLKTTLDKLTALDGRQSVLYPMELADALYQAGSLQQAGHYYEMALAAATKDNASDYQWLLFQTANCLRQADPARAAALYEQVSQTWPNSVWAAAARARHGMLIWLQTNEQELQSRVAIRNPNEQ
jgi:tetratricopeptide (TPR) repeat protein